MRIAVMVFAVSLLAACSIGMSASRSTYKGDPALFAVGADRSVLESTFGPADMTTGLDNGRAKAIYKIDVEAHSAGARNAAVAGHAAADVLTLGLWEIVGTPLELAAQDKYTTFILVYDKAGKVESVETIKPK